MIYEIICVLAGLYVDLVNYNAYFKGMKSSFHKTCPFIARWGGLHCSHLEHQNRGATICTEHGGHSLHGILLARKQP